MALLVEALGCSLPPLFHFESGCVQNYDCVSIAAPRLRHRSMLANMNNCSACLATSMSSPRKALYYVALAPMKRTTSSGASASKIAALARSS